MILCGGECWLFSSFLLSFSGHIAFSFLYVVFALLVLVKLCSLVSLSLLLDLFFTCGESNMDNFFIVFIVFLLMELFFVCGVVTLTCYGRVVVFHCGDGSVCCSCRFCVVPVRNPLVWWSYVRSVSTKSLRVGILLHLSSPSSLVFVCGL